MKKSVLIFALYVLVIHSPSCGRMRGGGIVDNGNHVPTPTSPDPNSSTGIVKKENTLNVLNDFLVTVPSTDWTSQNEITISSETTLKNGDDKIVFSLFVPEISCEVVPDKTEFGILLYPCSATETIFAETNGDRVFAEHWNRSETIMKILRSFRRR